MKQIKQYILSIALILLAAPSAALANTVVILRPKAEAGGPHVRLSDIARIDAPNAYAANAIAAAIIAPSPAAGDTLSIRREDIRRRLAEIGLDPNVQFSGAETVVVSGYGSRLAATPGAYTNLMDTVDFVHPVNLAPPPSKPADLPTLAPAPTVNKASPAQKIEAARRDAAAARDRLSQAAEAYLVAKYTRDDVEVDATVVGAPLPVPANAFEVRVTRELGGRVPGRAQFEATWRETAESETETGTFAVDVSVSAPALVAARAIQKGERLDERDVVVRRVAMKAGHEYFIPRADVVVGLAATKPIAEGAPLLSSDLQSPPVVRRGDTVRVRVDGDGWTVEAPMKALADAGLRQSVSVEREGVKYTAIVTGPGRAHTLAFGSRDFVAMR